MENKPIFSLIALIGRFPFWNAFLVFTSFIIHFTSILHVLFKHTKILDQISLQQYRLLAQNMLAISLQDRVNSYEIQGLRIFWVSGVTKNLVEDFSLKNI